MKGDPPALRYGAANARGVPQVSKPAVSPISKSAGRRKCAAFAGLETRDTADLEVCGTRFPVKHPAQPVFLRAPNMVLKHTGGTPVPLQKKGALAGALVCESRNYGMKFSVSKEALFVLLAK